MQQRLIGRFAPAVAYLLTAFMLVGCGTTYQAGSATMHGELAVDAPDDASYDYKFRIQTVWDFNYDTREKAGRLYLIKAYLRDACTEPEIVGEQFLKAGSGPLGGERGVWVTKVRCARRRAVDR